MGQVLGIVLAVAHVVLPLIFKPPQIPPPQVSQPPPAAGATKSKEEMIAEARTKLGLDAVHKYNFGVVGQSGTGKSSLVNAFRGVADNDSVYAAPVGESETTAKPKAYPHPQHSHIVFWDLPGAGTNSHPASTYFDDKCLYAFDCLIIVTADRFMQVDLNIADLANKWGIPVFFVRSKADVAITARKRREPPGTDVKPLLRQEITTTITQQLQTVNLGDRKLYILSAWRFLDQDIPEMDEGALVHDVVDMAVHRRSQ